MNLQYHLEKYQITIAEDETLITSGFQQSFDLVSQTLLNPSNSVLLEVSSHLNAIQYFTFNQVNPLSIPVERDRINSLPVKKITP